MYFQVKLWSSQFCTQFLLLGREAWKFRDFNGVWTRDLAIPVRCSNQLSYEAISFHISFRHWFIPQGKIRTHKWPAPTGIARSRVQTPLKSWIFQASLRNCKTCVHNWEDHSFTWFDICSPYMIHFINVFSQVTVNFIVNAKGWLSLTRTLKVF